MDLDGLRGLDIYLATPYSKYPQGIEAAFAEACRICGDLLRRGLIVYSPIAHTHPIAIHANIDPYDHAVWLPFDHVRMAKSDAMLIAKMDSWDISTGIQHEIQYFADNRKPIFYLDPTTMGLVHG